MNLEYDSEKLIELVKNDLTIALVYSLALNLSLIPIRDDRINILLEYLVNDKIKLPINISSNEKIVSTFRELKNNYVISNLVRHNMIKIPLLNYTDYIKDTLTLKHKDDEKNNDIDLLSHNLSDIINYILEEQYTLNDHFMRYSPRFVNFYELNLFYIYRKIISKKYDFEDFNNELTNLFTNQYITINYYMDKPFSSKLPDVMKNEKYYTIKKFEDFCNNTAWIKSDQYNLNVIKVGTKHSDNIKVGLTNMKIDENNVIASMTGVPNINEKRITEIISIVNQAKQEHVDMLIFPEFAIPYDLVDFMAQVSKRNNIILVFGTEHIRTINNEAVNLIYTILPVEIKNTINGTNYKFKSSVVIPRLKNHYAPLEEKLILNYGLKIPKPEKVSYNLFICNGVHFTTYYCFEIANIVDRSLFKSYLDLFIVSECNKDTNYFSNIIESLSRDLHTYCIQVNSSDYGDTRITRPTKSEKKDIIKVKGGKNTVLLVEDIDLKGLRKFQEMINCKDSNGNFKILPPDFDINGVNHRLNKR